MSVLEPTRVLGSGERTAGIPSPEQIRASLENILASEEFAGSAQLSRFLRHVVENALLEEGMLLKESIIGVTVFNRGPGYDPKTDPIVRVEARRLRARLDAYYRNRGANDLFRISLPKGGYAPSFESVPSIEPTPSTEEHTSTPELPLPAISQEVKTRIPLGLWLTFLLLTATTMAAVTVYRLKAPDQPISNFWTSILQAERPALIIPADSGLVMLQDLTHQPVQLQEYITGDYRARLIAQGPLNPDLVSSLAGRRYTSIADLEFVNRLSRRAEAAHHGVLTRYARDVRVEDLKGNNLILLGARHSNPWVDLFEKDASFRIEHDELTGTFRVVNTLPQTGEPEAIVISPKDMKQDVYGIITYHPNKNGSGHVLVIAGTSVAGTEAAADFLLDDANFLPWLGKAKTRSEIRGFDILLHDRNLAGSAPRADVVAFHVEK